MRIVETIILLMFVCAVKAGEKKPLDNNYIIENKCFVLRVDSITATCFTYQLKGDARQQQIYFPSFEINKKIISKTLINIREDEPLLLSNGALEYKFTGNCNELTSVIIQLCIQVSPDNPVIRFRYSLKSSPNEIFTKHTGFDNFKYLELKASSAQISEINISDFNERFHATHLVEKVLSRKYFENKGSCMGPIISFTDSTNSYLVAYEHGSQYPDEFLTYKLNPDLSIELKSAKGNYFSGEPVDGYSSVWLEFAGVKGNEDTLAFYYRKFVLQYLTQNTATRKPYIFYNTWGQQERTKWAGGTYLSSMTTATVLKEIDQAHLMGVEVFVLDVGWFNKTGDWKVDVNSFPDTLKEIKTKLSGFGMKLGLWFNPTLAAISSEMYKYNSPNLVSFNGHINEAENVWGTEKSSAFCLVSNYWKSFADQLIRLSEQLGVTYFKFDAVSQYGCNADNHYHGGKDNTLDERSNCYAFRVPEFLNKIVDRVATYCPEAIFDFDITESGRSVGLQLLSSGKYFIMNNGPYFHNFDLAPTWQTVLSNGNSNIFVNPGPARGWFTRSVLDYDKWIPSVLFLTHYQADGDINSQMINLASLILGQNGIWGDILSLPQENIELFHDVLQKYKAVREDITTASAIQTGSSGDSQEIYEKINPVTGKGCIVIFTNAKGNYFYISNNKTLQKKWSSKDVKIKFDKEGHASISVNSSVPSAYILFFGIS